MPRGKTTHYESEENYIYIYIHIYIYIYIEILSFVDIENLYRQSHQQSLKD